MKHYALLPVLALALTAAGSLSGQQSSVSIDGKAVSLRYTPEAAGGRKLFGGVVPFGKTWKVGAGNGLAFHTDGDLVFKGAVVPKGDYTLYVLPAADKWLLIINRATGAAAQKHDPGKDVGRATMVLGKAAAPVESLKVTLTKTAARAAKIEIAWGDASAMAAFHLDRAGGDTEW